MFGTTRPRTTRIIRSLTFAVIAATAACEQSTAPARAPLDPAAALADYETIGQLLDSEGFVTINGLGGRTPTSTGTLVTSLKTLPALLGESGGRHLGRTLVYSPTLDRYVIDSTRTGAPANGVRFIAYEQDAAGRPIADREIGYADLTDEGAGSADPIVLRLKVVTHDVTTLDYRTTVAFSTGAGSIDVSGFARDGAARFEFDISVDARRVGTRTFLDGDFELAVPTRDFRVTGTVRDVEEGSMGVGAVTVTAKHQGNILRSAVAGVAGVLDGTIAWNGATFVTITGPAADPILRGRTGAPLTLQEQLVVRRVMRLNDDVFDLVEELVEPVEDLVLLAWIL